MDRRHYSTTSATPLRMSTDAHDRPSYDYSQTPTIQRPPPALSPQAKNPSRIRTNDIANVQSAGASDTSGSSRDLFEKQVDTQPFPRTSHRPSQHDWQGADAARHARHPRQNTRPTRNGRGQPEMLERSSPALAYIRQQRQIEKEDEEEDSAEHALWILFWLSALDPLHSIASCLFSLFVVVGLLAATPARLLQKQGSLGDQIVRILAPIYRHHLEMMYAPSIDDVFSFQFAPAMFVAVQLVSPIVSIGVMFAAWISGAFWVFAIIMGNPDGTERRDDGADAVIAVRNWWEKYLLQALKRSSRYAVRSKV